MAASTVQRITREQLSGLLDRGEPVQVINVLDTEYSHLGMIPGTWRLPLAELDGRMDELDKSREVITYCGGPDCPASRQAAEKLSQQGFRVRAYEGGLKEWQEAGLAVDSARA
jgi:rhodanese-related sulfurtransferase